MCFRRRKKEPQAVEPTIKYVKFEGQNDDIVWAAKSVTQIAKGEKLDVVVPLSREGICLVDGVAEGIWANGRYTVNANEQYDAQDVKMYYINKTTAVPILWGTSNMIDLQDPVFEMPVRFGAHGSAKVSVQDSSTYLQKVVGTKDVMTANEVAEYFRPKTVLLFTTLLAQKMAELNLSYFELPSKLKMISDILLADLKKEFAAFGLNLEEFVVEAINISEDTLAKFSQDKEMVRRYKLRENLFQTMRESEKADKATEVDNQIRLIKAIGEAEKDAKDDRDITVIVKGDDNK